jgi:predicted ABC-type ATPase
MSNPRLFIIAGPNGSGKSLFSNKLTDKDLQIFDGDKHMAALVKTYPETGSEALWSYINDNIFEEQKKKAIESRLNYAFETNITYRKWKGFLNIKEYPAWVKPIMEKFQDFVFE